MKFKQKKNIKKKNTQDMNIGSNQQSNDSVFFPSNQTQNTSTTPKPATMPKPAPPVAKPVLTPKPFQPRMLSEKDNIERFSPNYTSSVKGSQSQEPQPSRVAKGDDRINDSGFNPPKFGPSAFEDSYKPFNPKKMTEQVPQAYSHQNRAEPDNLISSDSYNKPANRNELMLGSNKTVSPSESAAPAEIILDSIKYKVNTTPRRESEQRENINLSKGNINKPDELPFRSNSMSNNGSTNVTDSVINAPFSNSLRVINPGSSVNSASSEMYSKQDPTFRHQIMINKMEHKSLEPTTVIQQIGPNRYNIEEAYEFQSEEIIHEQEQVISYTKIIEKSPKITMAVRYSYVMLLKKALNK
jgi:hypothetical protein